MRVIAGKAKHITLSTLEGMETRPTTDRIKETLFNMLQMDIPGTKFLDLFAGSGGIGIEALSRGSAHCDFVEKNPKAVSIIKENLKKTKLDNSNVFCSDVFLWISSRHNSSPYDIIFMDPPYNNLFEKRVLEALGDSKMVNEDTLIIFECSLETEFEDYMDEYGFEIEKIKTYKTNRHVFVRKRRS